MDMDSMGPKYCSHTRALYFCVYHCEKVGCHSVKDNNASEYYVFQSSVQVIN